MTKYLETNEATIYHGNCLDELKNLPDNSVDAVVTDPPYGLGDSNPAYIADALKMWVGGDRSHIPAGKGFMGKQWDAFVPPPAVWDECLRVLKPGGHMLVFAGSRTQDLMALSIRLAGFEIRDSIAWIYGSGFPKSLDIAKALDKMAGVEFKEEPASGVGFMNAEGAGGYNVTKNKLTRVGESSAEAQEWAGWGTALKPAIEPVIVARKPLSEKNVASNVLKWGTGGINIDASRIGNEERTDTITEKGFGSNFMDDGWVPSGKTYEKTVTGRFPANVILSHTEYCIPTGEKITSKTGAGKRTATFGTQETVSGGDGSGDWEGYEYETEVFQCVEGCPVRELDRQSGQSKSTGVINRWKNGAKPFGGGAGNEYESVQGVADSGGASRFFYVAKANKKDRNEGLDGLEEKGKVFNGKSDSSAGNAEGSVEDKFTTKPQQNFHPTVKPTAIMTYLIKLVTPVGGVVLDPFTGSGSTGKAAVREGFKFIGIEMTDEYLPIIKGRIQHEIDKKAERLL